MEVDCGFAVSLSILSSFALGSLALAARLVAPPDAGPVPAAAPPATLPTDGVAPLAREQSDRPGEPPSKLVPDGVYALEGLSPGDQRSPPTTLPFDGAEPLDDLPATSSALPATPLGLGPAPTKPVPPDPKTVGLVRIDTMVGAVWRAWKAPEQETKVDAAISTSVEYGQMHGFSGAFHTEMIVVTERSFVSALDFPIGVGAIARGRLRKRALYGSVGLTAGVLVHRASREEGVIRRVDPDFRVPIRLAWTARRIGASLAFVTGYSVRDRIYERRGGEVLVRRALRVGLMLGLHWDVTAGRAPLSRRDRS